MAIDWKTIYKTGNVPIDTQHQQWFNKAAHLFDATDTADQIIAARKLRDYTRLHFQHEEEIMRVLKYPDAQVHTRRHTDTLVHMELLSKQIADGTFSKEKWIAFLSDLFTKHIGDADLKLTAFVTAQKRAARRESIEKQ